MKTPEVAAARSWLFVPGDRPERFGKAASSGTDIVVCDLEDGVADSAKAHARRHVRNWLESGAQACVRINPWGSDEHEADIAELVGVSGLLAVMVPKAQDASSLRAVSERLPDIDLIALVESAAGVLSALAVASTPGVARLAFGSLDYALDVHASHVPDALLLARTTLVLASRAAGRPGPIDSVTTDLSSTTLREDTQLAAQLGFTAKLCVHPNQVASVNEGLGPSEDDSVWARKVLDLAEEHPGAGAIALEGQMIDRPVLERARQIIKQLSARSPEQLAP